RAQRYPGADVVCRNQLLADRLHLRLRASFSGPLGRGRRVDRFLDRCRDVRAAARLPISRADIIGGQTRWGEGPLDSYSCLRLSTVLRCLSSPSDLDPATTARYRKPWLSGSGLPGWARAARVLRTAPPAPSTCPMRCRARSSRSSPGPPTPTAAISPRSRSQARSASRRCADISAFVAAAGLRPSTA